MNRDGIRVVFFDVGGTLIHANPSVLEIYRRALRPLGLRPDSASLERAYTETWAEFDAMAGRGRNRYEHFGGGEREYWRRYVRRILEKLRLDAHTDQAAEALSAAFSDPGAWALYPDVVRTLELLRSRGVRLGVISNWDSRLRGLLSALGIADMFEAIVVSCEAGVEKPSRAIFERAVTSMGVEPHQALHVGDDRVLDYEGARAAGLQASVIARGALPPELASAITTLDQIPELIARGADPRMEDRTDPPERGAR